MFSKSPFLLTFQIHAFHPDVTSVDLAPKSISSTKPNVFLVGLNPLGISMVFKLLAIRDRIGKIYIAGEELFDEEDEANREIREMIGAPKTPAKRKAIDCIMGKWKPVNKLGEEKKLGRIIKLLLSNVKFLFNLLVLE